MSLLKGKPLQRVGVTVGIGGSEKINNDASFRRVDIVEDDDVIARIEEALGNHQEPIDLVVPNRLFRLLTPAIGRLSDSILVSNLGKVDLPGVTRLEFYPVARGRSAVAFGAVSLRDAQSTLTIRARELSPADAESLLADVCRRLG
jgi:hypothetical protein